MMSNLKEFQRVMMLEGQSILKSAQELAHSTQQTQALDQAITLLHSRLKEGGKIIVTGVGKSGKVADKVAATLSSTGSPAIYLHPTEGLHGDLRIISSKDVVIAFSQTGNSEEIVRLLPSLKDRKVPVISISGNAQSQLVQKSQIWLSSAVEQEACPHNLAPTTSTTLMLALGDALAITLMQSLGFNVEAFARNHPGGALGRRLTSKVEHYMHTGSQVPTVGPESTMDEVVEVSTLKKQGAVLVSGAKQELLGVITDGDIRRALKHREKFFMLTAKDIMTQNPVTIGAQDSAEQALKLMEHRVSQISVLPVVDETGKTWIGLIRLHDLLQSL